VTSACDSTSAIQLSHTSAKVAPRFSRKRFSIWHPSTILNLQNFDFLSNIHPRNGNSHPHTNFDRNRIIHGWDIEIKLFSKFRPSTILNLQKLPFCHKIWICVWFFISIPNFALIGQYGTKIYPKNDYQYGVRSPSWICKILIFVKCPCWEWKSASVYQIWSKLDNSVLWYMDIMLFSKWRPSAILNFRKLPFWSRDLYLHVILNLHSKFSFIGQYGLRYSIRPPSWICKISIFCQISVLRIDICICREFLNMSARL